jgi:hypothetical protein
MQLSCEYDLQKKRLGIKAFTNLDLPDRGNIVVMDLNNGSALERDHLAIDWQVDPLQGFYINSIHGSLSGIACDLLRDPRYALSQEHLYLSGRIDLDLQKAQAVMDEEISSGLSKLELGSGYALQGLMTYSKREDQTISESLTFHGEFFGNDFEILGYKFQSMSGNVAHLPNQTSITHVEVRDPSLFM